MERKDVLIEQIIRWSDRALDPVISVRPKAGQMDDILRKSVSELKG